MGGGVRVVLHLPVTHKGTVHNHTHIIHINCATQHTQIYNFSRIQPPISTTPISTTTIFLQPPILQITKYITPPPAWTLNVPSSMAEDKLQDKSADAVHTPTFVQDSSSVPLWVWGRALAPRVSSITNTQLQRRRATTSDPNKCKANHGIFLNQLWPGINTSLTTTDLCLHSTAWQ